MSAKPNSITTKVPAGNAGENNEKMQSIEIEILGHPMPKQSARFRSVKMGNKSFIQSYQKKEIVNKEQTIAAIVQAQLQPDFKPFDCPVSLEVDFVFPIPQTMPKRVQKLVDEGKIIYKDKKPDCENLVKLVNDALEGVVYINDSRVCELNVCKYYGRQPKTIIRVTEII